MSRKLVTIRTISNIQPIPEADAIEVLTIEGWKVVSKKGEFKIGDECVYFEVDSFLPETDERFAFLMKSGVRTFEGERGHVLRTVRLRKQLSQGLALPLNVFPEINLNAIHDLTDIRQMDFSDTLGVKKWEPAIDPSMAGQVKGAFPAFIRKTDQERCQNLVEEIFNSDGALDEKFEVSLKMDGSSVTFYHIEGNVGVCSRNLELKINAENGGNTLVRTFIDSGLSTHLPTLGNYAIQGELMGPKIQGNREGLREPTFYVFDIQNLDTGEYLGTVDRNNLLGKLNKLGVNLKHVPIYFNFVSLRELKITNVDELLAYAEGPSLTHPVREGLVFKRADGQFSFKSISNEYLLKKKE